jgi:hypothetical protein
VEPPFAKGISLARNSVVRFVRAWRKTPVPFLFQQGHSAVMAFPHLPRRIEFARIGSHM